MVAYVRCAPYRSLCCTCPRMLRFDFISSDNKEAGAFTPSISSSTSRLWEWQSRRSHTNINEWCCASGLLLHKGLTVMRHLYTTIRIMLGMIIDPRWHIIYQDDSSTLGRTQMQSQHNSEESSRNLLYGRLCDQQSCIRRTKYASRWLLGILWRLCPQ